MATDDEDENEIEQRIQRIPEPSEADLAGIASAATTDPSEDEEGSVPAGGEALVLHTTSRRGRPARQGPLALEEEKELARRWRKDSDVRALRRLVETHLGLVIRIAMEFRHSGPRMEDLIQEGNLGLVIAARRFDPDRATRLATYASYWIRACMLEHVVRTHGPVRIGTTRSQRKIFFGLGRARRKLEGKGELPDSEKLAAELGVLEDDVDAMAPRLTGRDVSLDAPRGFDDRRSTGATIPAEIASPEDLVAEAEEDHSRRERLFGALKILDPRERAIIKARHMRHRPATLESLGKKFGISRERVRQLELRAKNKLRMAMWVEEESPYDIPMVTPGLARMARQYGAVLEALPPPSTERAMEGEPGGTSKADESAADDFSRPLPTGDEAAEPPQPKLLASGVHLDFGALASHEAARSKLPEATALVNGAAHDLPEPTLLPSAEPELAPTPAVEAEATASVPLSVSQSSEADMGLTAALEQEIDRLTRSLRAMIRVANAIEN